MKKVLLISFDVIGKSMAGPGIRYWEFAKALAPYFETVLATPKASDREAENFRWATYADLKDEIRRADVVVCQRLNPRIALWVALYGPKLIIDAYDPEPLEHLEIFKEEPLNQRYRRNDRIVEIIRFSLTRADGILAANDLQRDLWLGFLLGQGSIHPGRYDKGSSLDHYIAKVPFGLPDRAPEKVGMGLREKYGLTKEDTVLLWGGGIWNWFDPLTLIHAVALMASGDQPVKLVFMGIKHPNEEVKEMAMTRRALELAEKLGLKDKYIFFNFGWVPYEERQAFLLEADIGVSTHLEHLETRFAFRTRILDYLWAGLPTICTEGDYFAAMLNHEGAGVSVPYNDPKALMEAIVKIRSDLPFYKNNAHRISADFTWSKVTAPLVKMIENLTAEPKKGFSLKAVKDLVKWGCNLKNPLSRVK